MKAIHPDLLFFRMSEEIPKAHLSKDGIKPLCGRKMSRAHTVVRELPDTHDPLKWPADYCKYCIKALDCLNMLKKD